MRDSLREDENAFAAACAAGDVEHVRNFIRSGLDLKRFERGENSPGILAADQGNLAIVQLLVDFGADVNYSTDLGETMLGCAARSRSVELVQFLLERGANPRAIDRFGVSVLDCARVPENERVIELLECAIAAL